MPPFYVLSPEPSMNGKIARVPSQTLQASIPRFSLPCLSLELELVNNAAKKDRENGKSVAELRSVFYTRSGKVLGLYHFSE